MVIETTALTLPDKDVIISGIKAVNEFQQIVHQQLIEGNDWGIIPGTSKPTLLKPGAEKIAKLLGLSDQYEIVDRQEDWNKPFFRYLIKCKLIHVATQSLISEGLGECNSMESRYRWRWVSERDLPPGTDKTKLVAQERHATSGGHWIVFRFENDDIYSQVNTILKMAKKRALVDAALSAGRLSNVFTQDIEDMGAIEAEPGEKLVEPQVDKTSHWCAQHSTPFFKKGKMKNYAHPIEGTNSWCSEANKPPKSELVSEPVSDNAPVEEETPPGVDVMSKEALLKMVHKDLGDFYQACYDYLNMSKSVVDMGTTIFDKRDAGQRQRAWAELVEKYYGLVFRG